MKNKFETNSNSNVLFVTNQCNNRCIMCCQPPHSGDDIDAYYARNERLIKTAPKDTKEVCITGGEPTLAGDKLISLVDLVRQELPNTSIHILSNGRYFQLNDYTHRLAVAGGEKLIFGIPFHSDYCGDHDLIAGAKGAFNETIHGLYNLSEEGCCIELRIVINKLNYKRLPKMAEYIFKNLPFVSWVALMAMEDTGYAIKNDRTIWVEPIEYIHQLCKAVDILDQWRIPVSIYNLPLCLLPATHRKFAAQSISDWKTKYIDVCERCAVKSNCCGLFATSKKIFQGLKAI